MAQHSVLVSSLCPEEHKLWGLLHDAAEAYLADIARPVKIAIREKGCDLLLEAEAAIMKAVIEKFGLTNPEPAAVKVADDCALANEAYSFFGQTKNYQLWHHRFCNGYQDLGTFIVPQTWQAAEQSFLDTFHLHTRAAS